MTGDAKSPKGARRGESRRAQLIKGVLDLALLCILKERPHYGLEILQRMNEEAELDVADGTIYPLLHRMEASGFVSAEWRIEGDQARPRKYYALTPSGVAELKSLSADWRTLSTRMNALIDKSKP
ncbi:MAG: PadR family transcriptional regulator [Hyphomonadaceae bacterium]|nr:PadR family transcriptional regulator [Hyphomonadaceae bacterium]